MIYEHKVIFSVQFLMVEGKEKERALYLFFLKKETMSWPCTSADFPTFLRPTITETNSHKPVLSDG